MTEIETLRTDFIEKIGQIVQNEGLPKIAGRVFGLLVFDGAPVSFSDLAKELQVSRGSISSSVRLLEDRGVIRRLGLPGQRQDYFQLADTPFDGLLEAALKRTERARQDIETTMTQLPESAGDIHARLDAFRNFYQTLGIGLGHAIGDKADPNGAQTPPHIRRPK